MSELVYSFLIPEIEKMSFRQRGIFIVIRILVVVVVVQFLMFLYLVHQRQQRHLQAARDIIQETVEHAGNHPRRLSSSQVSEGASSQDSRISQVEEEQE